MNPAQNLSVLDLQLLHQLGDRIKRLRKKRGLGTVVLARQASISRTTLYAIETGDPNVSIGNYLKVMSCLGVSGEFALLASDVIEPPGPDSAAGRSHQKRPAVQVLVSTDTDKHHVQDLQSLALHTAAMRMIKDDDNLRDRALGVLTQWVSESSDSRSMPLWSEWAEILRKKTYRKVLGRSVHAQQLRQASPVTTILPEKVRNSILKDLRNLKAGIVIGDRTPGVKA